MSEGWIIQDEHWMTDSVTGQRYREIRRLDPVSLDLKILVDPEAYDTQMGKVLDMLPDSTGAYSFDDRLRLDGDRVVWAASGREWKP